MPNNTPAAEVTISHDLIHALLQEFMPELADLPLELIGAGWDNEIHRVGKHHAVRLPRREAASDLIVNEQRWLPELVDMLPVTIPTPVYSGKPAFGFPWHWSVVPWISGVALAHAPALDSDRFMDELAGFLNAMHVPAPEDAPLNSSRGVPLPERAESFANNLALLDEGILDDGQEDEIRELWESLVNTPEWGAAPTWIHGDLHPLNMLVRAGSLHAVIDFGDLAAGDPATDLAVAWMVFDGDQREEFRRRLSIDGKSVGIHTWNRAKAWALNLAVAVLAHTADDPTLRRVGKATLHQVLQ